MQLATTTLAAAEAARLISLGYRVLRMNGATKTPAVAKGKFGKANPQFTSLPADFTGPQYGLAILCGPCAAWPGEDLVCLDLDGAFDLAAYVGELPPTLTSKNGAHRYYRVPAGALKCGNDWFQTKAETGAALDVKTNGGYAVEYPSLDRRGAVVQYDEPGWRDPAQLPAEALDRLRGARAKKGSLRAQAVALAQTAPASVEGQNGSTALWNVALDLVRGLRLPQGEALAVLAAHYNPRCVPPWSEAELLHKVDDAFSKAEVPFGYLAVQQPEGGYLVSEKGGVKPCFENTVRYVRAAYPDLRWDEVAFVVYDGPERRVDVETLSGHVRSGAAVAVGLDPSKAAACDAIVHVAKEKGFNRTRDALEALPRWDGRRRLDRWLTASLGAQDSEYHRAVGRAWLISAMARAFKPGCKADHLLLLEGAQGIGKSTALSVLGGAGYKDLTFSAHDKDAMQDLRGAWMVEYSELSGLGKRDDEWLKGHIARSVDSYRASYGRDSQDYPRACVLAGTTNPQGDGRYLRDSENRRYWPVACEAPATTLRARLGWLVENRDQVLAEALAAYRGGEVWYLDREVGQTIEQERRREVDPLEVSIPDVVGDEAEVSVRMLRCDPRIARDLPPSAVGQGRAIARVLRRMGFVELPGGRSLWRRARSV